MKIMPKPWLFHDTREGSFTKNDILSMHSVDIETKLEKLKRDSYKYRSGRCINCLYCKMCFSCVDCIDCFSCCGLKKKKWHILNVKLTKAEYTKKMDCLEAIRRQEIEYKNYLCGHRMGAMQY